jgi:ubiquinone/menaquinone biosynthesis C-methylase UbiE
MATEEFSMPSAVRHRALTESHVLATLGLEPGMTVAEFGSSTGSFTQAIARAVQPGGRVHTIQAPHHRTALPAASCDRVLMAILWAELSDPAAALREAARLLREDGRLVIVEWHAGHPNAHIAFDKLVHTLEHNSWDVHRHGDAGEHCYFVEAAVSDESVQS